MKLICHFSPAFRPRLSRAAASAGELTGKRGVRWMPRWGPSRWFVRWTACHRQQRRRRSPAATPPEAAATAPSQPAATSSNDPWWTMWATQCISNGQRMAMPATITAGSICWGRSHETWRVDGQSAPVDAGVREWVAQHHAAPTPPTPPVRRNRRPSPPRRFPRCRHRPRWPAIPPSRRSCNSCNTMNRPGPARQPHRRRHGLHPCHIENTSSALHLTFTARRARRCWMRKGCSPTGSGAIRC